ncbi:hypothetical protein H5410_021892 [Solanum commersonii]|uniref:Uncharacterized protein n=1 Tax=Solanum commersonii TaxID=4109 RepID=A0A9J5ZCC1_SOLCO|nr:hypothetical protein H5410_021892 [Solanum commersonii]
MCKEIVISYKFCEHKKNSFVITTIVLEILELFALCDKLVSITLDNFSAKLKVINLLEPRLCSVSDSVKLFYNSCDKVENAFFSYA